MAHGVHALSLPCLVPAWFCITILHTTAKSLHAESGGSYGMEVPCWNVVPYITAVNLCLVETYGNTENRKVNARMKYAVSVSKNRKVSKKVITKRLQFRQHFADLLLFDPLPLTLSTNCYLIVRSQYHKRLNFCNNPVVSIPVPKASIIVASRFHWQRASQQRCLSESVIL